MQLLPGTLEGGRVAACETPVVGPIACYCNTASQLHPLRVCGGCRVEVSQKQLAAYIAPSLHHLAPCSTRLSYDWYRVNLGTGTDQYAAPALRLVLRSPAYDAANPATAPRFVNLVWVSGVRGHSTAAVIPSGPPMHVDCRVAHQLGSLRSCHLACQPAEPPTHPCVGALLAARHQQASIRPVEEGVHHCINWLPDASGYQVRQQRPTWCATV